MQTNSVRTMLLRESLYNTSQNSHSVVPLHSRWSERLKKIKWAHLWQQIVASASSVELGFFFC